MHKIKIMIVDDHSVVRFGLKGIIETVESYEVICDAETVAEAYRNLKICQPDLVLLDYKLPDGDGVTLCHQIKQLNPDTKVIILSAFCDKYMVKDAIQAGAEGYLMKTIDKKMILSAIEKVMKGEKSIDPTILPSLVEAVKSEKAPYNLAPKEEEILNLVAKGFRNKEISQQLFISEKTVRNYLTKIFTKIGVNNRTEAALLWAEKSFGTNVPSDRDI